MRIKHKVNVRIGEDTDMKNLLFGPDDTLAEQVIDRYERQTSGKFKIAANETESLPLGDITAVKGMFLKINGDALITLNGADTPIQVRKPGTTSTDYGRLFLEADIASVSIEAPELSAVEGVYCFWGDVSE
jgi:hypothetical protein